MGHSAVANNNRPPPRTNGRTQALEPSSSRFTMRKRKKKLHGAQRDARREWGTTSWGRLSQLGSEQQLVGGAGGGGGRRRLQPAEKSLGTPGHGDPLLPPCTRPDASPCSRRRRARSSPGPAAPHAAASPPARRGPHVLQPSLPCPQPHAPHALTGCIGR